MEPYEGKKHVGNEQDKDVQVELEVRRRSETDVETRDDTKPDRCGRWWSCKLKERKAVPKQRALLCV